MNKSLALGIIVAGLTLSSGATSVAAASSALSNLPGTPALPQSHSDSFTFFVCGDNRPASADLPITDTAKAIIAAARLSHPKFILWLGDTIYGKNPESEKAIAAEYNEFLNEAKKANVPIFNGPGNHEMDDQNDVPNPTMISWYQKYMTQKYGSFSYGNAGFIALDTEEIAPPGTVKSPGKPIGGDKNLDSGYLSATQLTFVESQLEAFKDRTHVFLFMHHPVYGYDPQDQLDASSAAALQRIIAPYKNVSYVLAAHEHLYYNPQSPSDVHHAPAHKSGQAPTYLVSGGAGAPLNKAPGGFYHYLVFEVHGNKCVSNIVRLQ